MNGMKSLSVFDPPMCCSTGVCGPSVDPELVQFAADLDWLKSQGVQVSRHNLAQQPQAFVQQARVQAALQQGGNDALPMVLVDDEVRASGRYPNRDELAGWVGVEPSHNPSKTGCCGSSGCC